MLVLSGHASAHRMSFENFLFLTIKDASFCYQPCAKKRHCFSFMPVVVTKCSYPILVKELERNVRAVAD